MINKDYNKDYSLSTSQDANERDKARIKANGEVFTPSTVIETMMDMISDESVWSDPSKTFLDPTCGNGNILIGIIRRRMANGVPAKAVAETTFGVELMEDNVKLCRERIANELGTHEFDDIIAKNIVCHDFFDWDFENWRPKYKQVNRTLF